MIDLENFQQTYKELVDLKYALDISSVVYITDPNGFITFANDKFCDITKYYRNELIHKRVFGLYSDTMTPLSLAEIQKVIIKGMDWQGEITIRCKTNTEKVFQASIIPILNQDGIPTQFIHIAQDITEQKHSAKELKRNHKLFIKGPVIVFTWNAKKNWAVEYVSENIKQIGYDPEEFISQNKKYNDIILEEDRIQVEQEIDVFMNKGLDCFEQEYRIYNKSGEVIWVYDFTRIVKDHNDEVIYFDGYILDITDRKKTEQYMQNSDKLSLVGELAAGVAHEIRNPLTSIKGFTQILKEGVNPEQKIYLDIILDEIDRIQYILTEFMDLAKPQLQSFKVHNVHSLLKDVISLMDTNALLKGVHISTNFFEEPLFISCDDNQIKQVFVNFIKNAIEAMTEGGTLGIHVNLDSDFVIIEFVDNGSGIPKHILKQLGKPFFTTKEDGNGLGLMVSYKIIEQHKGSIIVTSKENEGTNFTVKLPLEKKTS